MFSWIYKKLEMYFVSRWWEKWLHNRLQKIWEEGESLEEIDLVEESRECILNRVPEHKRVNKFIKNEKTGEVLVNSVDVYEGDFGVTKINWV